MRYSPKNMHQPMVVDAQSTLEKAWRINKKMWRENRSSNSYQEDSEECKRPKLSD